MNVTPGSVPHWLNVSFYDNDNNRNGSSDSAISNNTTTTINGTTQGNSTPQLWDLRWFALLSGPLLFGTIILPLITGPTIRYLCQSYVKLRVYWRLGFVLLATVSLVSSLIFNLNDHYQSRAGNLIWPVSDIYLSIMISYQSISAWRLRKGRRTWYLRVSLVVSCLCFVINLVITFYGDLPIPLGFAVWVAFIVLRMILSRREGVSRNSTASG